MPLDAAHVPINTLNPQVWISEIMLQQTQVSTVIPYYNKWMEKLVCTLFLLNPRYRS